MSKIKCDVKSCAFNDSKCKECTLKEIVVSCDSGCKNDKVDKKSETICESFKKE